LISWWNILEAKWHDYPNKNFPIDDEYSLVPIFWNVHDLVITKKSIQKQIEFNRATLSNTFSIKGKGYGSFLVGALSHQKSTQIHNFPFFFHAIKT
jgi:hypothetical protein